MKFHEDKTIHVNMFRIPTSTSFGCIVHSNYPERLDIFAYLNHIKRVFIAAGLYLEIQLLSPALSNWGEQLRAIQ